MAVFSYSKNDDVLEEVRTLQKDPKIEKIFTQASNSGDKYILFAKLGISAGLPDGLNINDYVLTDDGKNLDKIAGDSLYTVYKSRIV